MSDKIEYSRLIMKRSDVTGVIPTIPTGTTLSTFTDTDIFSGEFFLNAADDLLWIRTDTGILPINLSGSTGTTIPTLNQVLYEGNNTLGLDILVSSGDTIQYQGLNSGSTTTILGLDASGNTITTSVAGATQDLDNVLSYGNSTGAYDIVVSSGQTIQYQGLNSGSTTTILGLDGSGNTITTSVIDNDTYITGGTITYVNSNGTLDLFDNSGNTISITGLTDVYSTGGTYSNGTITIDKNDGTSFNVSGLFTGYTSVVESLTTGTGLSGDTTTGNITLINTAPDQVVSISGGTNISVSGSYPNFTISSTTNGGGGGGQVYYFNISNTQSPYYEFSPSATTVSETSISATTGNTQTAYIGGFMTPSGVPNITDMPAGILSFYLHFKTNFSTATFDAYVEMYKRTTGGTETLLFTSDTKEVIGTIEDMYVLDGFFSGATLNTSDRLVVKIFATNTSNTTRTIIFTTEGTQHYSFALTTIPHYPTLKEVLMTGNITDGYNIQISNNDKLVSTNLENEIFLNSSGNMGLQSNYTLGGANITEQIKMRALSGSDAGIEISSQDTTNTFLTKTEYRPISITDYSFDNFGSYVSTMLEYSGFTIDLTNTSAGYFKIKGLLNGTADKLLGLDSNQNVVPYTIPLDIYSTGGTYSAGTLTIDRNDGNSFNVSGFFTGYTSVVESLTAGTGLSGDSTTGNITLINTAPDQVVSISGGTGITTGGTYPNFTITNSAPDQVVSISGLTGIEVSGSYPNFALTNTIRKGSFGITIDGGGSAITTGQKGYVTIPYDCTITGWEILADVSGSIVVDVWKDTYANFPPTSGDTIAGSEKPTLSSAVKNQDNLLSTWTTSVSANDIIAFNVDSASTLTRVNLTIKVLKTS